jgi:hypothetical protein
MQNEWSESLRLIPSRSMLFFSSSLNQEVHASSTLQLLSLNFANLIILSKVLSEGLSA